jgi:ABC-type sulfate transport system permease component
MKPFSLVHHLRLTGAVIGRAISEVPAVVHGAGQLLELLRAKVIYEPAAIIVMVALLLVGQPFLASQVSAQDKTIDDEKIENSWNICSKN